MSTAERAEGASSSAVARSAVGCAAWLRSSRRHETLSHRIPRMFRVTLVCSGLAATSGEEAAVDIAREFAEHRTWHTRVTCEWDGTRLILVSVNDFDQTGQATLDEFGDCVAAYVSDPRESEIAIASVSEIADDSA